MRTIDLLRDEPRQTQTDAIEPRRQPTLVITRTRNGPGHALRELWESRELLCFLIWRDVKVKYKQTLLGATWAILQPLLAMVVFTLIFGKLARMPSDGIPYALFSYVALVPWIYFANALTLSGNSLVSSSDLITKVYFPRLIIPAAAVLGGLVDFGMAFLSLLLLMAWYGVVPGLGMLLTPVLLALTALTAFGLGTWLSALNVQYRDVRYVIPFLVQIWMFATPVVYPASLLPEGLRWLAHLNPMTGIIEGFRAALLGREIPWNGIAAAAAVAAVLCVGGIMYFRKVERTFTDVI